MAATNAAPMEAPFRIGMLIFPGMTSLDFAGPLDVFARLPGTQVHVLAKTLEPVVTDIGLRELPRACGWTMHRRSTCSSSAVDRASTC